MLISSSFISSLIFPSSSILFKSFSNSIPLSNKHSFFLSFNISFGVNFFSWYFLISFAIPFSYNSFISKYFSSLIFFSFSSSILLLLLSLSFFQKAFFSLFLCFSVFGKIGRLFDSRTVFENNLISSKFGFLISFIAFFSSKNKLWFFLSRFFVVLFFDVCGNDICDELNAKLYFSNFWRRPPSLI